MCVCVCVCVCVYGTHKCINLSPDDLLSCINHFDALLLSEPITWPPGCALLVLPSPKFAEFAEKSRKGHGCIPVLETQKERSLHKPEEV